MKVGILTFHYAHNYGAVLQTYALKTFLADKGFDVTILNYQNSSIAKVYRDKLPIKYSVKDFLKVINWCNIVRSIRDTVYAQSDWKIQCDRFNDFIQNVLLEGNNEVLDKDEVGRQKVDAFIAGSDQIWNSALTGGRDDIYFCDFDTKAKKIFYGASNGSDIIPPEQQDYYKKILLKATAVSVREKEFAINIEKDCGIETKAVCDPTLLLDKCYYEHLLEGKIYNNKNYILAYFVAEDDRMMEIAHYIARALNLEVKEIHYYKRRDLKGHNQGANIGPYEFLDLMRNAEFVVTNSFHGTVFSIIFNKKFYSVYGQDVRKDNLLNSLGIGGRHINKASQVDLNENINYKDVYEKLKHIRKDSEHFLISSLLK